MVKVFIDTNVWFSAFYGSKNCQAIITAHLQKKITAVVSQRVINETLINIKRKAPHTLLSFKQFMTSSPPELVVDPPMIDPKTKQLVEFKDQPIFVSAMIARVDYFVTGNIKDFKVKELKKVSGIKVITPKKMVEIINSS